MPIGTVGETAGRRAKVLLYGQSGSGKTYLASQLERALILDFEFRRLSMPPGIGVVRRSDNPEAPVGPGEIKEAFESDPASTTNGTIVVPCHNLRQVEFVLQMLRQPQYLGRFEAVVIDSLTVMTEIVEADVRKRYPSLVRDIAASDGDPAQVLTQEAWGVIIDKVRSLVVQFRNVPTHVVFLAHEEMYEAETGLTVIRPKLRGQKLLPAVQALVDFGLRIEVKNKRAGDGKVTVTRRLRVMPDERVWAKVSDFAGDKFRAFEAANMVELAERIASQKALPPGDRVTPMLVEEEEEHTPSGE